MLSQDVTKPAQTEGASPIVFVPKKDGSLHFPVGYRKLNNLTRRDSHTIAHIDECFDSLREATVFFTLHANSRYWKAKMK